MPAVTPSIQIIPVPDVQTWSKDFLANAFSLFYKSCSSEPPGNLGCAEIWLHSLPVWDLGQIWLKEWGFMHSFQQEIGLKKKNKILSEFACRIYQCPQIATLEFLGAIPDSFICCTNIFEAFVLWFLLWVPTCSLKRKETQNLINKISQWDG